MNDDYLEDEESFEEDEYGEDEPGIEPEWCEHCIAESEESGIEYTPDFYIDNGSWRCEHCGGYC